jgi:hypothetical protein
MNRPKLEGTCRLCGGTFGKGGMAPHLKVCMEKHPAAATEGKQTLAKFYHLAVDGAGLPEYWMHLEIPASAKLSDLDGFLRDIWLECCDHLSMFTIAGAHYDYVPDPGGFSMRPLLSQVLRPGLVFEHEYDFGSTTHLRLRVLSEYFAPARARKEDFVRILARDLPPVFVCGTCGKPAAHVCVECQFDDKGWLCDDCAGDHECGEEMLLPIVNSPRMGVCGYAGPEDENLR